MYTAKQLNTLRNAVINATQNYETATNTYVKAQYVYDSKCKNPNVFQDTVDKLQRDGFKTEIIDCYIALGRRMQWKEVSEDKLTRINVFSLLTKKVKEEKPKEYGARVLLKHLEIACANLKKKGLRTKGAREQVSAYGLCITQLKKSYSL